MAHSTHIQEYTEQYETNVDPENIALLKREDISPSLCFNLQQCLATSCSVDSFLILNY